MSFDTVTSLPSIQPAPNVFGTGTLLRLELHCGEVSQGTGVGSGVLVGSGVDCTGGSVGSGVSCTGVGTSDGLLEAVGSPAEAVGDACVSVAEGDDSPSCDVCPASAGWKTTAGGFVTLAAGTLTKCVPTPTPTTADSSETARIRRVVDSVLFMRLAYFLAVSVALPNGPNPLLGLANPFSTSVAGNASHWNTFRGTI
jgi:hypothetical protein